MTDSPTRRVECAAISMEAAGGPVPLSRLASAAGCGPRQLQRDFASLLGVSPRQYGQAVRTRRATAVLRASDSVGEAIYAAGYGSVRAFYEEAGPRLGMNPRVRMRGCAGELLLWSSTSSWAGDIVAVATPDGLGFVRIGDHRALEREMRDEFALATLVRDDTAMKDVIRALVELAEGRPAPSLPVDVAGTAFQARVWDALRQIPPGETRTYSDVAAELGEPTAVRAVARACATNPVALAIPCHRVLRADGSLAGYRWGLEVKESLLERERVPR